MNRRRCPVGQRFAALAPDADGGAIVAWQDNRANGNWDIYAQSTDYSPSATVDGNPEPGDAEGFSYPNPCGSFTRIPFRLERSGAVSLRVYDTSGRLVRAVADEYRDAGRRTVAWDGRNDQGQDVAGGAYLCRVSGPGLEIVRRVIRTR